MGWGGGNCSRPEGAVTPAAGGFLEAPDGLHRPLLAADRTTVQYKRVSALQSWLCTGVWRHFVGFLKHKAAEDPRCVSDDFSEKFIYHS